MPPKWHSGFDTPGPLAQRFLPPAPARSIACSQRPPPASRSRLPTFSRAAVAGGSGHLLAPCGPHGDPGGHGDPPRGAPRRSGCRDPTRSAQGRSGRREGGREGGGERGGVWRALRVFSADVTIAAGPSPCPVAADRGWFELVRCHSDAGGTIYRSAAAVAELCQPRCSVCSVAALPPPAPLLRLLAARPARRRRRLGARGPAAEG